MCGMSAGARGKSVLILDHAKKIAEKIRISGGGRCNFTNLNTRPEAFLSRNPHFCKSALAQYTQQDFIALVEKHGIAYHEKKLGQLFCDGKSQQIIDMLIKECENNAVIIQNETAVSDIKKTEGGFELRANETLLTCASLVIATGGLSIPKIGATKFGYEVARQFGLKVYETYPALVPFTFQTDILEVCKSLSGVSVDARVSCNDMSFAEGLLFTHRGLSGPSILQISSYWHEGDAITVNLAPDVDVLDYLKDKKQSHPKQEIHNALADILPSRLAEALTGFHDVSGRLADLPNTALEKMALAINKWTLKPAGTEGYRTAEVTMCGVDTDALSSKTMACKTHKGLYFIGEVVDVTGHLGGYNFQWAWSSGYVAGQNV